MAAEVFAEEEDAVDFEVAAPAPVPVLDAGVAALVLYPRAVQMLS